MPTKKVAHRSKEDLQWQETKRLAHIRDKNMCVLCRILTNIEYNIFKNSNPLMPMLIEVAHIESVGSHVEKTYDLDNVVCLCHAMHSRLDNMQDPITGKPIDSEEHESWWNRIKEGVKELSEVKPTKHKPLIRV